MPTSRQFPAGSFRAPRSWDVCVSQPISTDHPCRLTAVRCSKSSDTKSRSRRCHNVWHVPLQVVETGFNGNSSHALTGQIRQDERGSRPVQIPPRAPSEEFDPLVCRIHRQDPGRNLMASLWLLVGTILSHTLPRESVRRRHARPGSRSSGRPDPSPVPDSEAAGQGDDDDRHDGDDHSVDHSSRTRRRRPRDCIPARFGAIAPSGSTDPGVKG